MRNAASNRCRSWRSASTKPTFSNEIDACDASGFEHGDLHWLPPLGIRLLESLEERLGICVGLLVEPILDQGARTLEQVHLRLPRARLDRGFR